jgi:Ankyrin repeats (3 copies)
MLRKNKIFIIIFALITVINSFGMRPQTADELYNQLKDKLEKSVVKKDNTAPYSSIEPAKQYEMLRIAIETNKPKHVSLFLTYGFNPNRYHKQLSPLHYCVKNCRPKTILILAQYNPDLLVVDDTGKTPLDYAVSLQCEECIDAMKQVIVKKHNELVVLKKHCGLTKHILKPGPCEKCPRKLRQQLESHKLWNMATKDDYPHIVNRINQKNMNSTSQKQLNCS